MCGIVGYVGPRRVRPLLFDGLKKLEYRGYDSAGISVLDGDRIDLVRAVGNLSHLRAAIDAQEALEANGNGHSHVAAENGHSADGHSVSANGNGDTNGHSGTGIGHTRWATHGQVTEANAHPHYSTSSRIHIAVNGIVENYISLRQGLLDEGCVFTSETDAEVIAHLIERHYDGDLAAAVRDAYAELKGHYACPQGMSDGRGPWRG
jgi:glucosamine--fructose-6-phosphate aminotransferase (isomerizing)